MLQLGTPPITSQSSTLCQKSCLRMEGYAGLIRACCKSSWWGLCSDGTAGTGEGRLLLGFGEERCTWSLLE